MIFEETIKDLYKRPTFVSIFGSILFLLSLIVMFYQILFSDLGGGASLGLVIEIIFFLIISAIIYVDRKALINFSTKRLSIIEAILIMGFLTYYYFTHNNSFSIG